MTSTPITKETIDVTRSPLMVDSGVFGYPSGMRLPILFKNMNRHPKSEQDIPVTKSAYEKIFLIIAIIPPIFILTVWFDDQMKRTIMLNYNY